MEDQMNGESVVPGWITPALFEAVLCNDVPTFEKINDFKAFPALRPGENFTTLIVRVAIKVQLKDKSTRDVSYIMKLALQVEEMKAMNLFVSENMMYFDVLPEFEKMYHDAGVDVRLSAKSFKLQTDNEHVLLEDLRPEGFMNTDRLKGLDMEHTKCALCKLAQFHAVSACRVAKNGEFPPLLRTGFLTPEMKTMFAPIVELFRASFEKNVKSGECEASMKSCFDNFLEALARLRLRDENEFSVLNHGDYWCNNILFKYDSDGNVIDTIIVDYQKPRYGSPAQDILYFILTSVNIDLKLKHFNYFIRYYHEQLIEHLKILKYSKKLPTLRSIYLQLFRNSFWAVHAIIMVLPVVLLESSEYSKTENFFRPTEEGREFRDMLYANERYQDYINEILPWLHNHGFLDGYEEDTAPLEILHPKTNAATPPPNWLNADSFVDILKAKLASFKQIKKFDINTATKPGDNYSSVLYKVDIDAELTDGSSNASSFMLKVMPSGEQNQTIAAQFNTFTKEMAIYDNWLGRFERLYKDVGVDVTFGPRQYKFTKPPPTKTVLLDNLGVSGYSNADRFTGLDEEHVKCVLAKLAQFHAASAQWHATHGEFPSDLKQGLFCKENRAMLEHMMKGFMPPFIEALKTYEGHEQYIHKFEKLTADSVDVFIKINEINPNAFNVLNHGDCWINNILFKHDVQGHVESTYFIDYQMVKYGSPAQDLYYFLLTGPTLDLKIKKFDNFIKYYHDNLVANLKLLKYPKKIPTLMELHVELLQSGLWGVSTAYGILAVVLLEPNENAQLDVVLGDNEAGAAFRHLMYANKRYREHAEKIFPWLNSRGILDSD